MFKQSTDEIYLLNTINRWRNLPNNLEDYEEVHTINGQDYISPLNPLFLTAFKNLDSLNNFSFIQARDGLLDLLHFFNLYREPNHTLTKVLLNVQFSHIVPNSWRPNIIFYRDVLKHDIPKETDTLIYESGYRDHSINEKELYSIASQYKIKRFFITGEALPKRTDIFHKEISKCEEILKLKSVFLTNKEIFSFTEKNSILYKDKKSDIIYSKSLVSKILTINGVLPTRYITNQDKIIEDTPFSGITIQDIPQEVVDPLNIYLWLDQNYKTYNLGDYFEQLDNTNNTRKFYFESAYQFAKTIYENKNRFYI